MQELHLYMYAGLAKAWTRQIIDNDPVKDYSNQGLIQPKFEPAKDWSN